MQPVVMDAELSEDQQQFSGEPGQVPVFAQPPEGMQQQGTDEYFQQQNSLQVIQEYNKEELLPDQIKFKFWGLLSKSIKLGFWEKEDEFNLFYYKNIIKVGHIMSMPKHKYTFEDRQQMNMLDLLVYADFKRGIGMEKYRINERTLQATSVTQSIQGGVGGQSAKRGGMLAGLKAFFS